MTFEEWYERKYPDLDPERDEFYDELRGAWEAGYRQHYEDMMEDTYG